MANDASLYSVQYGFNVNTLLQQKQSRLRAAVTEGSYKGTSAEVVSQIGSAEMQPVTSRFGPMGRVDVTNDRRWVYPASFDFPQMVDKFDELQIFGDIKSAKVETAVNAANRRFDDTILAAIFADAKTGVAGGTTTSFDSTNQVVTVGTGSTGATGINVAKILAGIQILMANEVDLDYDPIFCAITAAEHTKLLTELEFISSDYTQKNVLDQGLIKKWGLVNFIHSERIISGTDDLASSSRQIPMWAKSGMHLGIWNDITTDISQRKDIQGLPWQAYVYMTLGATRTEEKKVVKIWCH